MKLLTVLMGMLFLFGVSQPVVAQNGNCGIEVLITLATITNFAEGMTKKTYILPSGKVRTIYDFRPKDDGKKTLTQIMH